MRIKEGDRQNIKPLNVKPLIFYSLEAVHQIFEDDQILISADDKKIKKCGGATGLKDPFLRPSELTYFLTGINEVLMYAISWCKPNGFFHEILVLLQATTSIRTAVHAKEAKPFIIRNGLIS